MRVEAYEGRTPKLDLRQYLNGDIEASGVFINRAGMVTEQFHVAMKGTWTGNDGRLEEYFTYMDGRKDERIWAIRFTDDHHFTATAHDVDGQATGAQFGNAVNLRYRLRVPFRGRTIGISMDDWMYLMDGQTLINRTVMRKFGFRVGELLITFRKKQ